MTDASDPRREKLFDIIESAVNDEGHISIQRAADALIESGLLAPEWRSLDTMPRDGRWLIGLCHDGTTLHRISWGYNRAGAACWCTADRSFSGYGNGLWRGWIDFPGGAAPPTSVAAGETND